MIFLFSVNVQCEKFRFVDFMFVRLIRMLVCLLVHEHGFWPGLTFKVAWLQA
jgi:hypothetical protein